MNNDKILGYDWSDIQRAQQGGRLGKAIDLSRPPNNPASIQDRELLALHGMEGLQKLGLYGVIDRLQNQSE